MEYAPLGWMPLMYRLRVPLIYRASEYIDGVGSFMGCSSIITPGNETPFESTELPGGQSVSAFMFRQQRG